MDNSFYEMKRNNTQTRFALRGSLGNLKSKSKNKTRKLLNNFKEPRNLAELYVTYNSDENLIGTIDKLITVYPDIIFPVAEISVLENIMNINILTNSKKGTFIYQKNKDDYFNNLGKETRGFTRAGYFLRRGAGSKLLSHVIDKLKDEGIKTIIVRPDNKKLENYYVKFGFKSIPKVPYIIRGKHVTYCENIGGRIMIKEL